MERRADDAERELLQWKGEVPWPTRSAMNQGFITGVAAFGLFIELIEHFVEGMVHAPTMADDYRFVEARTLAGENTHKGYRLGDRSRSGDPRRYGGAQDRPRSVRDLERVREGELGRGAARPRRKSRSAARSGPAAANDRAAGRRR
jgi:ribonuclease R